jgi:hypothetical protein
MRDRSSGEQRLVRQRRRLRGAGEAPCTPLTSLFHAEAKAPTIERAFAVALTLELPSEGHDTGSRRDRL